MNWIMWNFLILKVSILIRNFITLFYKTKNLQVSWMRIESFQEMKMCIVIVRKFVIFQMSGNLGVFGRKLKFGCFVCMKRIFEEAKVWDYSGEIWCKCPFYDTFYAWYDRRIRSFMLWMGKNWIYCCFNINGFSLRWILIGLKQLGFCLPNNGFYIFSWKFYEQHSRIQIFRSFYSLVDFDSNFKFA